MKRGVVKSNRVMRIGGRRSYPPMHTQKDAVLSCRRLTVVTQLSATANCHPSIFHTPHRREYIPAGGGRPPVYKTKGGNIDVCIIDITAIYKK